MTPVRSAPPPKASIFPSSERFQILRRLGEGGMGVVYEALDLERNVKVALKTLRSFSPEGLARFKREFRAIQDIHHGSVVSLGELISEDEGRWFFTMELVEGEDFLTHVRPWAGGDKQEKITTTDAAPPIAAGATAGPAPSAVIRTAERPKARFDPLRLRPALVQLTRALIALHDAAKVHRDIKPSNVRVTPEKRVVLLDFGLVAEASRDSSTDFQTAGTPAYMAPEQARAQHVGPAADWYAMGVMLYEALTGRVPFEGAPYDVLVQKQERVPEPPSTFVRGVPDDLERLCIDLLRFDPPARPTGPEVLARLTGTSDGGVPTSRKSNQLSVTGEHAPFVGRVLEIGGLGDAFNAVLHGATVAVLVHGESGVGKTTLVRTFTERLQASHEGVMVLHGRCHEREVVPYKALDDVVDALSRRLARMPDDSVAAILPVWAAALTHVFPVLRRAKVFAKESDARGDVLDVQELRRRAFAALRELLRRLALRQPTVIVVDDLQWADADSLSLLGELLRQPDAPPILLVATVRTGDAASAREQLPEVTQVIPGDVRSMHVARLAQNEARELAEILVARAGGDASAASIAEEAAGHPLYIDELVRHTSAAREVRTWKLEEALWARVGDLPEDARRVVELVSVAEARLAQETIAQAANLDGAEFARTVSLLRAANLVRTRGVRGSDAIEAYHDRVREAVVGHLSAAELRARHEMLALALEASTTSDPRALAIHWRGAGDRTRAARYAIVAAEQATKALAFDRAAQWYELALELHGEQDPTRRALRIKLGDAHANAGRGARAAQEYQGASEGANQAEALDLRRRAAEQLLRSGHFDRGIAATQEVLGLVDMQLPATPLRAIMALLFWRAVLWIRGLRYTERDATQVPARDLARIDTCWALGVGLALTDNVYGALFNTRTVILALRAGEPRRIARALGLEIGFSGSKGVRAWPHTQALMHRASVIAERTETPGLIAWVVGVTGVGHYLNGYYRRALELCDRAERALRQEAAGQVWEVASVRLFAMNALGQLGDLREIRRRQPAQMREALERGDLFAAANLGIGFANLAWLAADDVDGARRGIERAMEHWSKRGFHLEHFYELLAKVNVELYAGEGKVAEEFVESRVPLLVRAQLHRPQALRIALSNMRARCALAMGAATRDPVRLKLAAKMASALDREGVASAHALSILVEATIAHAKGQGDQAAALLRDAIRGFDAAEMQLHAAVTRRSLGAMLGGSRGRPFIEESNRWMESQEVANSARLCEMIAPGLPH